MNNIRMGMPQAKRVWYTIETQDGEFMQIEGEVGSAQIESQQEFIDLECDSMIGPILQMPGHRRDTLTVEFLGGFRMHRLENEPSVHTLFKQQPTAETVESADITPDVARRYKLE